MDAYVLKDGKKISIGPYTTSKKEIHDLVQSWLVIALAFSIATKGLSFTNDFLLAFVMSAFSVGIAFVFHELAHKIAAQQYGCFAEFRSSNSMLLMGLLMSFVGFLFFAPGAVLISGPVGKRRNGIISAVGPATNFGLAIIFLLLLFYQGGTGILGSFFEYAYMINAWLGLFNMIPFWMFDGKKILAWDKRVYYGMVALGVALLFSFPLLERIF